MKEGTGEDPFADDTDGGETAPTTPDTETDAEAAVADTQPATATDAQPDLPYVLTRKTAKEGRDNRHVAMLRDEYAGLEDDVHERVADAMGMRKKDVSLFDVREAFIALADRHEDDLAEILLSWGYEHRRE